MVPKTDELADKFYAHLFDRHPQIRALFPEDMTEQKKNLIGALVLVVENLRRPDALGKALSDLAIRHIGYGVVRQQYPIVGEILLETLAEVVGDAWNDQLHEVWADAYAAIQQVIFAALDEHERKSAA